PARFVQASRPPPRGRMAHRRRGRLSFADLGAARSAAPRGPRQPARGSTPTSPRRSYPTVVRRASRSPLTFHHNMKGGLPLLPTRPDIPFTQLRALATPLGLRIEEDGAGFPVIHGKYGRVLWFDGDDLLVTADGPTWAALDAIPGLRRHG